MRTFGDDGRQMRVVFLFLGLALVLAGVAQRIAGTDHKPAQQTTAKAVEPARSRNLSIGGDANGHFQVKARVDGYPVEFMVDTGATTVALTTSDAQRLGIRPASRDFTVRVNTANGIAHAAQVNLATVEVGDVTVRDVRALVAPDGALSQSLLGMSFLSKLRRFEYANGRLILEQ